MYLVVDQRRNSTHLVFTFIDPRREGCKREVIEGVELDYDRAAVHRWEDGEPSPEVRVGVDPANPKHYKVFKYARDLDTEGFTSVAGSVVVLASWQDYLNLRSSPPAGDEIDEADWFDYLDRVDEEARLFRKRVVVDDTPVGRPKDEVAAWLAKWHLRIDSDVHEIWYLPSGSPLDEIRLLELSDRVVHDEGKINAVNYRLDMEGIPFRLMVADASTEGADLARSDPQQLPDGWSLERSQSWTRSWKK